MITMPALNTLVAMLEKKMEIFAFVSQMSSNTMDFLKRMEKNSRQLSILRIRIEGNEETA